MIENQSHKPIEKFLQDSKTKSDSYEAVQIQEEIVEDVHLSSQPEITFKIVVIGESFVGKTSLIRKFVGDAFQKDYNVTVGADFVSKVIKLENDDNIKLNIWDTCGHDVFRSMTSSFYRGSSAVFLTFSIGNRKSFEKVKNWHQQFSEFASVHACVFLIGTKVDGERKVKSEDAMELLKKLNGILYFQTSSETGQNIQQGFQNVAQTMYKLYKTSPEFRQLTNPLKAHGSFLLDSPNSFYKSNGPLNKKKKCC